MPVNSHYLPQLLLKGFSFRQRKDEFYVHVYRKGCLPFSSNTKGVGAEGNFYGNENIEHTLSDAETQFAGLTRHLREGHCESSCKPLIDRFVAHSLIRTRAFRDSVHVIGATVLSEGFQEFVVRCALLTSPLTLQSSSGGVPYDSLLPRGHESTHLSRRPAYCHSQ